MVTLARLLREKNAESTIATVSARMLFITVLAGIVPLYVNNILFISFVYSFQV
jgi:hypothetical protein